MPVSSVQFHAHVLIGYQNGGDIPTTEDKKHDNLPLDHFYRLLSNNYQKKKKKKLLLSSSCNIKAI